MKHFHCTSQRQKHRKHVQEGISVRLAGMDYLLFRLENTVYADTAPAEKISWTSSSGSSQNSTDVISITSWLKFTYEHQFAMKISRNLTAMNRAGSASADKSASFPP